MQRYIIARHFVHNCETLELFRSALERFSSVQDLSLARNSNVRFGLKLTLSDFLEDSIRSQVYKNLHLLPKNFWFMLDPSDRGPGTSFRQVVYNATFQDGIITNPDLDQYDFFSEKGLEDFVSIMEKMEEDTLLWGMGSRDISIRLAIHPNNNNLRIIHELYHSASVPQQRLVPQEKKETVCPGYAFFGESSGVSFVNTLHPFYPTLIGDVSRAASVANLCMWTGEYYSVLRATQFSDVAKGYVRTHENPFYSHLSELEERLRILQLIKSCSQELGKTNVKTQLQSALEDDKLFEKLSIFYSPEDVSVVRKAMHSSLVLQNI